MLRQSLRRVLADYDVSRKKTFRENSLAKFIRNDLTKDVKFALGSSYDNYNVIGSAGSGNWAEVPWVAILDPMVTDTVTRGYYVVFLFNCSQQIVYLSLNQGTTSVIQEFKKKMGLSILRDRATLIRNRVHDVIPKGTIIEIDLNSKAILPTGYEAGHAFGYRYDINNIPSEDHLRFDLQTMISVYQSLVFRGGLNTSPELADIDPGVPINKFSITEVRQYRQHRQIERDPQTSKVVKKIRGYRCEACNLKLSEMYGQIGNDYIEAHHLKPLRELKEGVRVNRDPKKDFVVLCANCHRIIHRQKNVADITVLKNSILLQYESR